MRYRLASELAGWIDGILSPNGLFDFQSRDVEPGQLVWIHPDPERVLARSEDANAGDAWHPENRVVQVDNAVVRQELGIELTGRRNRVK